MRKSAYIYIRSGTVSLKSPNAAMIEKLVSLADTVLWVKEHRVSRSTDIPADRSDYLKQLELLALVSRDGSGVYVVQKERLRKLLNRLLSGCSESEKQPCIAAYVTLLSTEESNTMTSQHV